MYSEDELIRIKSIYKKLNSINAIIKRHGNITKALQDFDEGQPALLMLLVAIAEQFNKLQKQDSKILENFDSINLKGIISVRNFIVHDYDGINLAIVENGLRDEIPLIAEIVGKLVED